MCNFSSRVALYPPPKGAGLRQRRINRLKIIGVKKLALTPYFSIKICQTRCAYLANQQHANKLYRTIGQIMLQYAIYCYTLNSHYRPDFAVLLF